MDQTLMQKNDASKEGLPSWDLSDLYDSIEDPRIQEDMERALTRAQEFESSYKGKLSKAPSAKTLLQAIRDYETLLNDLGRCRSYCFLMYATHTDDSLYGAKLQQMKEQSSTLSTHLIFFDLELGELTLEEIEKLLSQEPLLYSYRNFLIQQHHFARHHLKEDEEKILSQTSSFRSGSLVRLFTETTSRWSFPWEQDGEVRDLTLSELTAYNYDPDREKRIRANQILGEKLKKESHLLTFCYNHVLGEKSVLDKLRGYENAESARHLGNELDQKVINTMVEVCRENYSLVAKFYQLKRSLLGLDKLTHVDRYAPLSQTNKKIPYEKAQEIVLDGFESFLPQFKEIAGRFFDNNWIDVPSRVGKRSGAFCAGVTPDHHPYVLLNYTEKTRDVTTLAHELGHGIHDVLASKQSYLNYHPVLPMAETASTFAELLVFEKLFAELTDPQEKLELLASKLEDTFATIFRQIAMFCFERRAHEGRREQGELSTETFNQFWQEEMQAMFQDSVELGEEHALYWLYIPHIYNTPFYVYAYAFGELLVLSLYQKYRETGEAFIPLYIQLLETGGSLPPQKALEPLGIDLSDREFWQGGCRLIASKIQQLSELYQQIHQEHS